MDNQVILIIAIKIYIILEKSYAEVDSPVLSNWTTIGRDCWDDENATTSIVWVPLENLFESSSTYHSKGVIGPTSIIEELKLASIQSPPSILKFTDSTEPDVLQECPTSFTLSIS